MLRRLKDVALLVILGCLLQQQSVGAVDPHAAPKKQDAQAESISPGFKDRRADNPHDETKQTDDQNARIANYTLGLAALTAILAAAAIAQVVISRRTVRRQLRAYVVVQKATVALGVD